MQVYFSVHHGMGDAIAHYFCKTNYGKLNPKAVILPNIELGLTNGTIEAAAAVIKSYTPATADIFRGLHFPIRVVSDRSDLDGDWHDIERRTPQLFSSPSAHPIAFPISKPLLILPERYVLFTDMASHLKRCNANHLQYHLIKSCTRLPIIKIGNCPHWHSEIPPRADLGIIDNGDLDLYRKTSILETAWLAKNATVIVSALTFMRCFSSLFNVPVIEICEDDRISADAVDRTKREYQNREYGMSSLNKWYKFPSQHRELERELLRYRASN